jgi:Tfp pilus assembly protein PilF
MIAVLLQSQNKTAEARQRYEQIVASSPRAVVAANNLAWIYAEEGTNLETAARLARQAKAAMPDRPEVSDTLGWVLYKKGEYTTALPAFLDAVRGNPSNAGYQYHLGLTYAALRENGKAAEALQRSIALDGTSETAQAARQALAALQDNRQP